MSLTCCVFDDLESDNNGNYDAGDHDDQDDDKNGNYDAGDRVTNIV